jgi:hypothetical protein
MGMIKRVGASVVVAGLAFAAMQLHAHHGAGVFNPEVMVTVSGTVTDFQFVNPHVLVFMTVTDEDGAEQKWSGELTAPNRLSRMTNVNVQWTRDILKPGDEIMMEGHPANNGAPAMDIITIVNADGVVLIGGARTTTRLNTN